MKTHKNKVGRKTREFNREKYIATLKSEISDLKRKIRNLDKLRKERYKYVQDIHNFIGTKGLKKFRKSAEIVHNTHSEDSHGN